MRFNYPSDFATSANELVDRCFIVSKGYYNYDTSNVGIYIASSTISNPVPVYHIKGDNAPSDFESTVVRDTILNSGTLIEKFDEKGLTLSEYKSMIDGDLDTATQNFINQFKNIGGLGDKLNSKFSSAVQSVPEWADAVRGAYILDILTIISQLCSNTSAYDEYISDYLANLNREESDSFYIPVIIAGFVARNANHNENLAFYSLPAWYDKAYSVDQNKLLYDVESEGGFGDYGSDPNGFQAAVKNYLENKVGLGASRDNSKYYQRRTGGWYSEGEDGGISVQAFTCMPTDYDGNQTGNLGYTYLAMGGGAGAEKEKLGRFVITASTTQKTVAKGTPVAALINIDLSCDEQTMADYKNVFAKEKSNGYTTAKLIINYSLNVEKGSGSSSPLMDSLFTEGDLTGGNTVIRTMTATEKMRGR